VRRFALDQNFPDPIVDALKDYITEAELVSVRKIDVRFVDIDDWQLLLCLHNDPSAWDGLITNDAAMLSLPREMCVLQKTHLKLVIAESAGHDPLKATGLIFANLPQICERLDPNRSEVWRLRVSSKNPVVPMTYISGLAGREKQNPTQFFRKHSLSDEQMARNPLREDRRP
jgi:hypothetical protein